MDSSTYLPGSVRLVPIEKIIYYKLGERILPISTMQFGIKKDIVCINLHDNETTSVEAAKIVLASRGGILIKIYNDNERVIRFRLRGENYSFDPNRIFSRTGIEESLKENGPVHPKAVEEIEKLAERVLELFPEKNSCVIALHNNTEEAYSIKLYLPGMERQNDAEAVRQQPGQDVDDFAFTTDRLIYTGMAESGYNSILQNNISVKQDGSLSVYCGEKNIRYVNIETEHGHLNQYVEMLNRLILLLE